MFCKGDKNLKRWQAFDFCGGSANNRNVKPKK